MVRSCVRAVDAFIELFLLNRKHSRKAYYKWNCFVCFMSCIYRSWFPRRSAEVASRVLALLARLEALGLGRLRRRVLVAQVLNRVGVGLALRGETLGLELCGCERCPSALSALNGDRCTRGSCERGAGRQRTRVPDDLAEPRLNLADGLVERARLLAVVNVAAEGRGALLKVGVARGRIGLERVGVVRTVC